MKRFIPFFVAFLLTACGDTDPQVQVSDGVDTIPEPPKVINLADWQVKDHRAGKLLFSGGDSLDTHLYELHFIGQIPAKQKVPYLILSGRNCQNCNTSIALYVHSPSDGEMDGTSLGSQPYPGTVRDYLTESLISSTRVFYGEVIKNRQGVIWYENESTVSGGMQRSIYLLHEVNGKLQQDLYSDTTLLSQTLALCEQGRCTEIKGREFTVNSEGR